MSWELHPCIAQTHICALPCWGRSARTFPASGRQPHTGRRETSRTYGPRKVGAVPRGRHGVGCAQQRLSRGRKSTCKAKTEHSVFRKVQTDPEFGEPAEQRQGWGRSLCYGQGLGSGCWAACKMTEGPISAPGNSYFGSRAHRLHPAFPWDNIQGFLEVSPVLPFLVFTVTQEVGREPCFTEEQGVLRRQVTRGPKWPVLK